MARFGRIVAGLAAFSLLGSTPARLPPIPALPSTGWPLDTVAEPFARQLMARVTAEDLDTMAESNSEILPGIFRNLGTALLSSDAALQAAVKSYATALARVHAQRVRPRFTDGDVQLLVVFQVLDPLRYGEDDAYRNVVDSILPQSLSPTLPEALRRAAVNEINRVSPISFDTAEALASAAGLVRTASRTRFVDLASTHATINTSGTEPIEASIYSINSRYATTGEARAFLTAVRAAAPNRRILVIGDEAIHAALSGQQDIQFVDNFSRPLTLWPRDPFSVARTPEGRVVFVNRPNLQSGREEDANMVRVLLNALPPSLDMQWGKPRWASGGTSFHNGQVLLTSQAAWISIHSVEPRARQLLGVDHVPVERFHSAAGIATYIAAVQRAAGELSTLYGRPVRFVHDVPGEQQSLTLQQELMTTLSGGAGFDLDSIVTLLPGNESMNALVADPSLGAKLAAAAPDADWRQLGTTYGLQRGVASTRDGVVQFQSSSVALGLQQFLDRCAKELAAHGVRVRRLPLLIVPAALLAASEDRSGNPYFLVGWNNVVLEHGTSIHAEGFASGFASGDRAARAAFEAAGYHLTLFPPLPRSVILNGGYRCASNEVRAMHR